MAHAQFEACIEACNHCAAACLQEENVADMRECIRLDVDCAAICLLSAAYMARGSDFVMDACAMCADVCEACAEECGRHDMAHCRACAAATLR